MRFLSDGQDSHIARKFGSDQAEWVREKAIRLASRLEDAPDPNALQNDLLLFDKRLKAAGLNPGTSADLTVATLLAKRLENGG